VPPDLRDDPVRPELGVADLNIGVLFFLAVSALEIVGLFNGRLGLEQQVRAALRDARGQPDHLVRPAARLRGAGARRARRLDADVAIVAGAAGLWFVPIRSSASWRSSRS